MFVLTYQRSTSQICNYHIQKACYRLLAFLYHVVDVVYLHLLFAHQMHEHARLQRKEEQFQKVKSFDCTSRYNYYILSSSQLILQSNRMHSSMQYAVCVLSLHAASMLGFPNIFQRFNWMST